MSLAGNVEGSETTTALFVHFNKCSEEERARERLCVLRVVVFRFEAVITDIAGRNMFLEWFQTPRDDVSPGELQPGISRG